MYSSRRNVAFWNVSGADSLLDTTGGIMGSLNGPWPPGDDGNSLRFLTCDVLYPVIPFVLYAEIISP
ncbi:hypothetical protein M378DRAFT_13545 [Amanita muscaria Koide BX008]|uniref:Uncharacterized protein n=1 Tax=Amanita muscaria (strain Koide BX008) TaxID=946122 RepID=A0A0C2WY90_AMAMK|nr:hypothetical protein M378DRAFT_13545 [Amanita muscaria Koide BX008]